MEHRDSTGYFSRNIGQWIFMYPIFCLFSDRWFLSMKPNRGIVNSSNVLRFVIYRGKGFRFSNDFLLSFFFFFYSLEFSEKMRKKGEGYSNSAQFGYTAPFEVVALPAGQFQWKIAVCRWKARKIVKSAEPKSIARHFTKFLFVDFQCVLCSPICSRLSFFRSPIEKSTRNPETSSLILFFFQSLQNKRSRNRGAVRSNFTDKFVDNRKLNTEKLECLKTGWNFRWNILREGN